MKPNDPATTRGHCRASSSGFLPSKDQHQFQHGLGTKDTRPTRQEVHIYILSPEIFAARVCVSPCLYPVHGWISRQALLLLLFNAREHGSHRGSRLLPSTAAQVPTAQHALGLLTRDLCPQKVWGGAQARGVCSLLTALTPSICRARRILGQSWPSLSAFFGEMEGREALTPPARQPMRLGSRDVNLYNLCSPPTLSMGSSCRRPTSAI